MIVALAMVRQPIAPVQPAITAETGYTLGIVEFDDDGKYRDPAQARTVLHHIEQIERTRSALVITFVHGWNNNCTDCNENLRCFRDVLNQVATLRTFTRQTREVIGVYIGWRGKVLRPDVLNKSLSFWNRMRAARRLGQEGDLRAFLLALSALRQRPSAGLPNLLVITAHSLGATAAFTALTPLYEAGLQTNSEKKPFAETTILVNPAFSASDYEKIDRLARQRYEHDDREYDPDLVIAGSEGDLVTREIYPLGFLVSRAKALAGYPAAPGSYTTVTNYAPLVTHELRISKGTAVEPPRETKPCACPFSTPPTYRFWESVGANPPAASLFALVNYKRIDLPPKDPVLRMELTKTGLRRGPFMVVRVDQRVVRGHSDFYSPEFREFIIRLMNKKLAGSFGA